MSSVNGVSGNRSEPVSPPAVSRHSRCTLPSMTNATPAPSALPARRSKFELALISPRGIITCSPIARPDKAGRPAKPAISRTGGTSRRFRSRSLGSFVSSVSAAARTTGNVHLSHSLLSRLFIYFSARRVLAITSSSLLFVAHVEASLCIRMG